MTPKQTKTVSNLPQFSNLENCSSGAKDSWCLRSIFKAWALIKVAMCLSLDIMFIWFSLKLGYYFCFLFCNFFHYLVCHCHDEANAAIHNSTTNFCFPYDFTITTLRHVPFYFRLLITLRAMYFILTARNIKTYYLTFTEKLSRLHSFKTDCVNTRFGASSIVSTMRFYQ